MKKTRRISLITLVSLLSFQLFGQEITYKVTKDQPDDVANYFINVGLIDAGFALDNPGFGLAALSLNSVVHYKNKVGGEFTYKKYLFSLADVNEPGSIFELGGFYNLGSKTKSKKQKVVLAGNKKENQTTFSIPATVMRSLGVRAGFNTKNNVVQGDSTKQGFQGSVYYKSSGLYAGILITSQLNLKCHTSQYGIKGAGFYKRTYIDILFNPIRTVTAIEGVTSNYLEGTSDKAGALGFRVGFEFMQPEPKKVTGSAKYQKIELGMRPWDGYYVSYTLGFNYKRKVKAMSSFKVVREME